MTTIMNQVTCSLCNIKIDAIKCKEHTSSTDHSIICRKVDGEIAVKSFKKVVNANPKKDFFLNLEN